MSSPQENNGIHISDILAERVRAGQPITWIVGERFDDRFETQVGGHRRIARCVIEPIGGLCGLFGASQRSAWDVTEAKIVYEPSLIIDYGLDGKAYTAEEAAGIPELAGALARLRERDAAYVALIAKWAVEDDRYKARKRIREDELQKRQVRFLPEQVLKRAYVEAGLQ